LVDIILIFKRIILWEGVEEAGRPIQEETSDWWEPDE
jgi:hypothetical protein